VTLTHTEWRFQFWFINRRSQSHVLNCSSFNSSGLTGFSNFYDEREYKTIKDVSSRTLVRAIRRRSRQSIDQSIQILQEPHTSTREATSQVTRLTRRNATHINGVCSLPPVQRATALSTLTRGHCHARVKEQDSFHQNRTHSTRSGNGIHLSGYPFSVL